MTLVVGVDGGGSGTRAVVLDEADHEVGRAKGPPAVVGAGHPGAAVDAVNRVVLAALERAAGAPPADALCAGLAGAGEETDRAAVEHELAARGLASAVRVVTDAEAAFFDAFGRGPGVLLIAGTGSIAWARSEAGEAVRVGGWGSRLGDEGSGYAIGLAALKSVVRAHDGRGAATAMAEALGERLGFVDPRDLVAWLKTADKRDVAALAPTVAWACGQGDRVAEEIVQLAASDLEAHVRAALRRAGPWTERAPVALWGGLLGPDGPLRDRLIQSLAENETLELTHAELDPARGAARLARDAVASGAG